MTLDEAIKHAEEVADKKKQEKQKWDKWLESDYDHRAVAEKVSCELCAEEHRQLAEWLKDYKQLLEHEPTIIYEIPKDYKYDTETENFLVYRHKYTGDEIHIERPIPLYRLEQEPCEDAISREDALLCLTGEYLENYAYDELIAKFARRIKALPSSQPNIEAMRQEIEQAKQNVKSIEFAGNSAYRYFNKGIQKSLSIIDKYLQKGESE